MCPSFLCKIKLTRSPGGPTLAPDGRPLGSREGGWECREVDAREQKIVRIYVFLLWLIGCVTVRAQTVYGTSFGHEQAIYRVEINGDDLASTPDWLPSDENPPLSPRGAATVARETVTQLMPETAHWDLAGIELCPADVQNKWFYEVSFREPSRIYSVGRPLRVISTLVRMDGKSGTIVTNRKE